MLEMLKERKAALEARGKKGFTLMEMLIVIAIIAVLVAIAIPVLGAQLDRAKAATDEANIRDGYAAVQVGFRPGLRARAAGGRTSPPVPRAAGRHPTSALRPTAGSSASGAGPVRGREVPPRPKAPPRLDHCSPWTRPLLFPGRAGTHGRDSEPQRLA